MGLELLTSLVVLLGFGPPLQSIPIRPDGNQICVGACLQDGPYLSFSPPPLIRGRTLTRTHALPFVGRTDQLSVPIPLNAPVRAFIDSFRGQGRLLFSRWYARMGRYGPLIHNILESHQLPPELVYLCMVESGFNPDAVSRASAVGLWQFMEVTGREYGLLTDPWIDERRDPTKATEAAARHLKDLKNTFGDWALAFAAYNAGVGSVHRAMRRTQSNDFWEMAAQGALPTEATRYVPKILAAMLVGQNPGHFGLAEVQRESPITFATVHTPATTDLERMASRTGIPLKRLSDLNPELLRGFTPPYVDDYPLRVPHAQARIAEDYLRRIAQGPPGLVEERRVRFGERLRHIARAVGTSHRRLRRLNGFGPGVEPRVGQILVVPKGVASRSSDGQTWIFSESEITIAKRGRQAVFFPVRWRMHLAEIAEAFKVSVGDLALWNGLDPVVPVHRGMALKVWVPADADLEDLVTLPADRVIIVQADSPQAKAALAAVRSVKHRAISTKAHKVRKGQNLWRVAKKHGVTVEDIARANGLRKNAALSPGQVLKIPLHMAPKPKGKAARRKAKTASRGRSYKVRPGDSLWKIARRFGISVDRLRRKNRMRRRTNLRPGQRLVIPR